MEFANSLLLQAQKYVEQSGKQTAGTFFTSYINIEIKDKLFITTSLMLQIISKT